MYRGEGHACMWPRRSELRFGGLEEQASSGRRLEMECQNQHEENHKILACTPVICIINNIGFVVPFRHFFLTNHEKMKIKYVRTYLSAINSVPHWFLLWSVRFGFSAHDPQLRPSTNGNRTTELPTNQRRTLWPVICYPTGCSSLQRQGRAVHRYISSPGIYLVPSTEIVTAHIFHTSHHRSLSRSWRRVDFVDGWLLFEACTVRASKRCKSFEYWLLLLLLLLLPQTFHSGRNLGRKSRGTRQPSERGSQP